MDLVSEHKQLVANHNTIVSTVHVRQDILMLMPAIVGVRYLRNVAALYVVHVALIKLQGVVVAVVRDRIPESRKIQDLLKSLAPLCKPR